jgi:hypothetical protein
VRLDLPSKKVPGFILLFLIVDSALVLLYLLDWKVGGLFWKVGALLDPNGYADLVNWYVSMKLFLIACGFAVFARHTLDWRHKGSWILPLFPLVFAALSFDEVVQISTWLGYKSGRFLPASLLVGGSPLQREIILGSAAALGTLAVALAYCVACYTRDEWGIRLKFLLGGLVFASAVALEVRSAVVPINTPRGALQVAYEELGALLGTTLILWATYDLLVAHRLTVDASRRASVQP